eukprot:m.165193 g.165193  ORF g.165193 m.165193 type:complete len:59 (-) comp13434_c0_seq8:75-251(-)
MLDSSAHSVAFSGGDQWLLKVISRDLHTTELENEFSMRCRHNFRHTDITTKNTFQQQQ